MSTAATEYGIVKVVPTEVAYYYRSHAAGRRPTESNRGEVSRVWMLRGKARCQHRPESAKAKGACVRRAPGERTALRSLRSAGAHKLLSSQSQPAQTV